MVQQRSYSPIIEGRYFVLGTGYFYGLTGSHMMQTYSIITDRLILRPQAITDYQVWYPMYSDPQIFHLVNSMV